MNTFLSEKMKSTLNSMFRELLKQQLQGRFQDTVYSMTEKTQLCKEYLNTVT